MGVFFTWMVLFAVQKPLFWFYNHELSANYGLGDLLDVVLNGLKLDATMAGYLTVIPLLVAMLSVWTGGGLLRGFLKVYFGITGALVALIFALDEALYGYWQFRLDATLLFYLESPANAMASVPIGTFLLQTATAVGFGLLTYFVFARWVVRRLPEEREAKPVGTSVACLLAGGLLFIAIRGGVTTSTANVGMVYFSRHQFLNHAAINPCFSLLASLAKQQDFSKEFQFFDEGKRIALFGSQFPDKQVATADSEPSSNASEQTLNATQPTTNEGASASTISRPIRNEDGSPATSATARNLASNEKGSGLVTANSGPGGAETVVPELSERPNILLVVLEGFSANVVEATGGERDVTPNLNRLSREGVLFRNMYASSFRTDRGLVAVVNGYLAQPTTSIMKYPVKSRTLPSLARSLRDRGYHTDVLYGGDINFTNMRSFFFSAGYDELVADVDFPLSSRLSKWGANDDITFERLYDDLVQGRKEEPWLSTFLTLSSHEPFEVPYDRLAHPYLNSVAFTDSCIGHFVERIRKTPVWENLLIVFVSDHGFRYPETLEEYAPGRFHIPCLWIGGAVKRPAVIDRIVSQTDLAATLLARLGLPHEGFDFSRDIFAPDYPASAFYSFNNGFGFVDSTGVSVFDNAAGAPLLERPEAGSSLRLDKGKAILQTLYQDLGRR